MVPYPVKVFKDYLTPLMVGVRVASKVPATRPASLVTITTAPAGESAKPEQLSWRRLVFRCYHADEATAADLCEQVRDDVLQSRFARIGVRKVRIVGEPANFPDPDDSTPRFQLTVDVLMRVSP